MQVDVRSEMDRSYVADNRKIRIMNMDLFGLHSETRKGLLDDGRFELEIL